MTTLSTEMVWKPIPRIPSNLAARNVSPGSLVASAKVWSFTASPATWRERGRKGGRGGREGGREGEREEGRERGREGGGREGGTASNSLTIWLCTKVMTNGGPSC